MLMDKMERGLAYGEACFETFRVIHAQIFHWHEHAARLQSGLAAFAITVSERQLEEIHAASLQAAAAHGDDALVRLTVSGGEAAWGLFSQASALSVSIQAMPYQADHRSISLRCLDWPSPPVQRVAKFTADYAATLRVLRGERQALFVHRQQLVSAATANVMILRQGRWWTPSLAAGVLPGVVRQYLLATGVVQSATCPESWLAECDAMVLTASSFFVRPVLSLRWQQEERQWSDCSAALKQSLSGITGVPKEL